MRRTELPLIPDGPEGREWAERELADPRYAAAEPTPLDRIAQSARDILESIFGAEAPPGLGPAVLVGLALLVIALIAVSFAVWGRPHVSRRATQAAALFGEDVVLRPEELRREASARAAAGDWEAATVLRFRALARASVLRGVVAARPGATAQAFTRSAARAFPAHAAELRETAAVFDDVRYLRRPATLADYERVAATDEAVASARPAVDPLQPGVSGGRAS